MAMAKRFQPDTTVTRDLYETARDSNMLRIGGDLWTNEYKLLAQAFRDSRVASIRVPRLTTGLWAEVDAILTDGTRGTVRVFDN
jgi:hypothetical protein